MTEKVRIFETFHKTDLEQEYSRFATDVGTITQRDSHITLDGDGRFWYQLVVWYLEPDAAEKP